MDQSLFLIAGLGNPGREYARSYHNIGFMALDRLAQRLQIPVDRARFHGIYGLSKVAGRSVMLLKPATYMNLSGDSIAEAARFYKVPSENILVLYDDIDIPLGKIRIRETGGPGTHNGMRSVVSRLGTDNFPRIRIGIGPLPEYFDIVSYVLRPVADAHVPALSEAIEQTAAAAEVCIREDVMKAMNRYNQR
jgi:PTH1 family peptidyl-tRNA hydrolase